MPKPTADDLMDAGMIVELMADDLAGVFGPAVDLIADDLSLLGLRLKLLAIDMGNAALRVPESKTPGH